MTRRFDFRVVVAGAGAVGSAVAIALAKAGGRVTLADPAPLGANASGVAAGMLAPAFESLFDEASPPLALLRQARDLWPELAASVGLALDRAGAMAVGSPAQVEEWATGLAGLGAPAARLSSRQARGRAPWLTTGLEGVWTSEDWRLEPMLALAALRAAAVDLGVVWRRASVTGFLGGEVTLSDGVRLPVDALVIATGAAPSLIGVAPELACLTPIKGHILRAPALALGGPVARLEEIYICPSPGGALIGSTMEVGRADTGVDADTVARLGALAARAAPVMAESTLVARAGVRAATPDGLPLVGAGQTRGVWLAVGARRNGWLLAPLIARALVEGMIEQRPGAWVRTFDPTRFNPAPASPKRTLTP